MKKNKRFVLPRCRLKQSQAGLALAELLLVLAILAPLAVLSLRALSENTERSMGAIDSEKRMDFTELAKNYYLANAQALRAAMLDGTGAEALCRLGVDAVASDPASTGAQANDTTRHTCAIDMSVLRWKKMAPAGAGDYNLHKQRMVAIFRLVHDTTATPPTPTEDVELLSVGAAQAAGLSGYAPDARGETRGLDPLVMDANVIGASGGVIPDGDRGVCKFLDGDMAQSEACGVQGGWRVKLDDFIS